MIGRNGGRSTYLLGGLGPRDCGTKCFERKFKRCKVEKRNTYAPECMEWTIQQYLVGRLVDLCDILRKNYYHPDFQGSYSINEVLPVVVPGMGYEGTEIDIPCSCQELALFYCRAFGSSAMKCEETKKDVGLFHRFTLMLAILSTSFLAFNMLAMLIWKKQLFLERGTISSVGVVILIGFALVLLFDISSLGWILSRLIQKTDQAVRGLKLKLVFGGLCLFLLMGAKVMIDEIGREYSLGWEVLGEWIILYVLLTIQGIYNLTILMHLLRTRRV